MTGLFTALVIIVSILLILVVLVQESKGGGITAGFQAQSQQFGMRRSAEFIENATWVLASVLIVVSIVAALTLGTGAGEESIELKSAGKAAETEVPVNQPAAPTTPPAAPTK